MGPKNSKIFSGTGLVPEGTLPESQRSTYGIWRVLMTALDHTRTLVYVRHMTAPPPFETTRKISTRKNPRRSKKLPSKKIQNSPLDQLDIFASLVGTDVRPSNRLTGVPLPTWFSPAGRPAQGYPTAPPCAAEPATARPDRGSQGRASQW